MNWIEGLVILFGGIWFAAFIAGIVLWSGEGEPVEDDGTRITR